MHNWRYLLVTPFADLVYCHPPPSFPFTSSPLPTYQINPFTYLEIPLFDLVVRMPVHSCPWLAVN
jgi:hypothetical protein